jgi:hypothetical protein
MPLLATLIGSLATGLATLLSSFMAYNLALKAAAYAAYLLVVSVFLASVFVCTSGLYSAMQAMFNAAGGVNAGLVAALGMGVTMLIPANAGAVIGCVSSVWIACQVYKMQQAGLTSFGS